MISFRFKRDIHGQIFGCSVHDFTVKFAWEFYADRERGGLWARAEFPYGADDWQCIDKDFTLTGSDDYKRKHLRRAVVQSDAYRRALVAHSAACGTWTEAEIAAVCNCVPISQYADYLCIMTGGLHREKT